MAAADRGLTQIAADPAVRLVLLHGDDPGLIRERADELAATIADNDPMRIVEVGREAMRDPGLLAAEASTAALMGGRKAIRVRDLTDAAAPMLVQVANGLGPGLVLAEVGPLAARPRLRTALPATRAVILLACVPERGAALGASVRADLTRLGVEVDQEALDWLTDHAAEDRLLLRRHCEKLAAYVGAQGAVTLAAVLACVEAETGGEADIPVRLAFAGRHAELDGALEAALANGVGAVTLLRSALWFGQRLLGAVAARAAGADEATALRSVRPPVLSDQRPAFTQALRRWALPELEAIQAELLVAERGAKTTGSPDALLVRGILNRICRARPIARGAAR